MRDPLRAKGERLVGHGLRKRAVVVGGLAVLAALAVGAGCAAWNNSREDLVWKRIQERKVFTVATDATYPPFEATDSSGNFFGYDIDLGDAIGRQWGVTVQFESLSYDALLDAVISGRDDAVISAFVPQPDQLKDVSFSQPYFTGGTVVVMQKSASAEKPVKDWSVDGAAWAAGKTLAVERGANGDARARQWARSAAGVTVLPEPSPEDAMLAVDNQTAQAALVDRIDAYNFLVSHPNLTIVEPPVDPEPYTVAVNAHSQLLFQAVQKALQTLDADGTLSALRGKWMGDAAK